MKSTIVLLIILAFLLGACSAIAGDTSHWPATLIAVIAIVIFKFVNDRIQLLAWPMEFLLAAGVTMIVINLARLYFLPIAY
jgi:hypothetical protein